MMLASIGIFVAGSAACAAAHVMMMLIPGLGLQGIGGGGILPLAQAILADAVAPRERGRYQPVGGPRQGGSVRRGEEGRAGGAAQHAARARHVSAGAAGARRDRSRHPARTSPCVKRPDCVAGVGGLELRNVVANYPFESSRGFPGSSRIPAMETTHV